MDPISGVLPDSPNLPLNPGNQTLKPCTLDLDPLKPKPQIEIKQAHYEVGVLQLLA